MKITEHLIKTNKTIICAAIDSFKKYENGLKDLNRMTEAENKIMALSSCAFVRAFNSVARLICNARIDASADTYCSLAEKAVELLLKGEEEKDVLCYFAKLYVKERGHEIDGV